VAGGDLADDSIRLFSMWAPRSGLEILLLVTGALLLARFASWHGGRITARIDDNVQES
jgi:small conductance mechanosensitive channel